MPVLFCLLISLRITEDSRYNGSVCYQRFCCKIEFAVIKKLDRTHVNASVTDTFKKLFFINQTFCVFVRIASARRFQQIHKTYVFLRNKMGISVKKIHDPLIFDVFTNFAVITNVVIKRVTVYPCDY